MADTWVNGGDTAANFDGYAAEVVRTTGLDNALLTFDRSALPEGAEIVSAELTINTTFESGAFGKEMTVLNTEAFDSTAVTFDTAPAIYNPGAAVPVTIGADDLRRGFQCNSLGCGWRSGDRLIATWANWQFPPRVPLVVSPSTASRPTRPVPPC